MSALATLRTGLMWAMWLVLAAYVGSLALHAFGWGPSWEGWFGTVVNTGLGLVMVWLVAVVCWVAAYRVRLRRPEVLLAAAGVTSYALGHTYFVAVQTITGSVPYPSLGDVASLGFKLLMMAALAAAVRRHVRGLAGPVWLDSAVGMLGAATVLAVVLRPVQDAALAGPFSMSTVVSVAYPMLDLLLTATIVGILALGGVCVGGGCTLLIVGLLVYAVADVVFALQVTAGTYVMGSSLEASWAIGLVLVALWVDATARRVESKTAPRASQPDGATALVLASIATALALVVLVMESRTTVSVLAVALATATLLAAAVRAHVAFRQLRRMADLRVQATTDELTGLSNRRVLYADGQALLVNRPDQRRALLLLDLDKFREVNDSLGHHAGDQLLVEVGARLREHIRDRDLLARLGGDEFAVLLKDAGRHEAVAVADKLRAALAEPFTTLAGPFALETLTLHSTVSIGIALFPDDGPDLSTLLRKADIAMYKAKALGDGHHVYSRADDTDGAGRLQTVDELRTAMTSDQLVVYYQPKIDLATGEVHNVEALVRWDHPARGLLYPGAFIDLVESSGLMRTMTRRVLSIALDQAAAWQSQGQDLTIAVNLSASSLVDSGLPDEVAAMLAARDLPSRALQLEITEEFLMADRDRARRILTQLRDSGVQISVDDYGTGYSSLSYLRDLPIDELKLDRSFVVPMADDARAAALVASTIDLAHSLGLRIVAEGVETEVAYAELTCLGCDQAQGFYMSRAVPATELEYWLSSRRAAASTTDIADANKAMAMARLTGVPREGIIGTPSADCFTEPQTAGQIRQLVLTQRMTKDYPLPNTTAVPDTFAVEAMLEATRGLLWITSAAEAAAVATELIAALGGTTVSADVIAQSETIPVDVSFGDRQPLLPAAPRLSVARILLERYLPGFVRDAQRAVELTEQTTRLAEDASIDALTGLVNKRFLGRALGRLRAEDTVIMIDLDHFKAVNDRLGHPEGDRVLRALGHTIASTLRATDQAGRHGGEEFVVIIADSGAEAFLTRLQLAWVAARPYPITFSAGIAPAAADPARALDAADRAMYRAKEAGRDQWQWATDQDYR